MMKIFYNSWLLAITLLIGGNLPIMAQYTVVKTIEVNHEEIEKTSYSGNTEEVDVASICEALGISDISEAEYKCAFSDGNGGYTYENLNADGWRDPETKAQVQWGTADGLICTKVWYTGEGLPTGNITYVGCIDETHVAGESYTFPWAFVKDEKAVIININITFITEPEAPEYKPTILETITIDYEALEKIATTFTENLPLGDDVLSLIKEKLEVSDLSECTTWIVNTDGNFVENSTDGWRDGEGNAAKWTTVSGVCVKLDLPNGIYNYIGTYDTTHVAGEEYHAKWGVVNSADNAVVLDLVITFVAPSINSLTDLTNGNKGSVNIVVNRKVGDNSVTGDITINVSDIAAALGCAVNDLKLYAENAEGITNAGTAHNGGFWLDADGKATNRPGVLYFQPVTNMDFSISDIGVYEGIFAEPTVYNATLYLVNEEGLCYYTVNLIVNIGIDNYDEDQTTLPEVTGEGITIILQRTFVEGWNTLVLPFCVSTEQMQSVRGAQDIEFANFEGTEDVNGETIVKFAKAESVSANTPCLIYLPEAKSGLFKFENVDVTYIDESPTAEGEQFDFVGSYTAGNEKILAGDYILTAGNVFSKAKGSNTLKSYRAFLRTKTASQAKTLSILFDNGNTATNINAINAINGSSNWYTISGQRLQLTPATRGIYIKDGKKHIVK